MQFQWRWIQRTEELTWCNNNHLKLNISKTKKLVVHYRSLLWCAGIHQGYWSQQTEQADKKGQLCGRAGTRQSGVSGREEDEEQKSPPRQPLPSFPWWAVADRQLIQPLNHPNQVQNEASDANLYLLPSDCTADMVTTVYSTTQHTQTRFSTVSGSLKTLTSPHLISPHLASPHFSLLFPVSVSDGDGGRASGAEFYLYRVACLSETCLFRFPRCQFPPRGSPYPVFRRLYLTSC